MGIIKFLNSRKLNKIFNYEKNGEKRNIQIKEKNCKKTKIYKGGRINGLGYNIHMTK